MSSLSVDPTRRFSQRAENYVKYRPHYPGEIIEWLSNECGLTPEWTIADIGSGTGFLAELFLQNGNPVYGVEPNADMRHTGEEYLGEYPRFTSIEGTAENTALVTNSMDLVTAGQAFHWFEPDATREEFQRILKTGGWVVLVWNERRLNTNFQQEYETLLLRYAPEYKTVIGSHFDPVTLNRFFDSSYHKACFGNVQKLDFNGFCGRLQSASYCPEEGTANHKRLFAGIELLFDQYVKNSQLDFEYDTKVFLGQL